MKAPLSGIIIVFVAVWIIVGCSGDHTGSASGEEQWALQPGFEMMVDSDGFAFPTSLSFIQDPGEAAGAPLYFVSELRGTIKVVARDRTVHEFASVPVYDPESSGLRELPNTEGEGGLGGMCLDQARGYVFATFTYTDSSGVIRNGLVRFESQPHEFGLRSTGVTDIGEFLREERSGTAHQIGGCAVVDDALYVGVGDGWQPALAQTPDRLVGKTLRLTVDGAPHPDNPFFDHEAHSLGPAAKYVYSVGHRNPFGLTVVGDSLFVTENGDGIDRFLRVEPGQNYLWDGDDFGIGAAADAVISPSVAPVQMDYLPTESQLLPERFRGAFFFATSSGDKSGIMMLGYDLEDEAVNVKPSYFVRLLDAPGVPGVTATAFGPAGSTSPECSPINRARPPSTRSSRTKRATTKRSSAWAATSSPPPAV